MPGDNTTVKVRRSSLGRDVGVFSAGRRGKERKGAGVRDGFVASAMLISLGYCLLSRCRSSILLC
jgi:hypothetical protein